MRNVWLAFTAAILLAAAPAFALPKIYSSVVTFDDSTASNTLTFAYAGTAFSAHIIDVCNKSSADNLYFATDAAASAAPETDHISIPVGPTQCYRWQSGAPAATVNVVCAAGKTCLTWVVAVQ